MCAVLSSSIVLRAQSDPVRMPRKNSTFVPHTHTHTEKMNHANKHTNGHRGIWPSLREGSWTGRRHEGAKGGDDGDAQEESFAGRPTPQTPKSLRAQLLSEELSIVCLSVFDELELWPPTQWSFCLILSAPGYPSQPLP